MQRTQIRQVGDRLTPIAAQLTRPDGTIVDLTDTVVKFLMYDVSGTLKVAEVEAVIVSESEGRVKYAPKAVDVDTPGNYNAYFRVYDDVKRDSFPVETGQFRISIQETT